MPFHWLRIRMSAETRTPASPAWTIRTTGVRAMILLMWQTHSALRRDTPEAKAGNLPTHYPATEDVFASILARRPGSDQ